ncbi:hypothetical protein J1N35_008615 [Gossypium stocksii]|uniref:RNase H type-1 domain-containing protein n=1 Tax=Gossypium stocksii TaxID=47602 RepID=A0A9D3W966_9ROSI|nr:hypothetical protein J1N35_008615 [Gossypium stocksii]
MGPSHCRPLVNLLLSLSLSLRIPTCAGYGGDCACASVTNMLAYAFIPCHFAFLDLESTLRDWVLLDGSWNVDMLHIWLPDVMIKRIDKGITWSCLFGLITWRIWKNRNLFIFQNINWTAYDVIKSSLSWAQHFEPFLIGTKTISPFSEIHHHFVDNWVHLFSDGTVAKDSGNVSAGGVVRDRVVVRALSMEERVDFGITLLRRVKRLLEVVRALSMEETVDFGITLLRRVKRLLRSESQWEIKYVPRECNLIADQLAKISLS